MSNFFVYEDWTLEASPRCFYVGKGSFERVQKLSRNEKHKAICLEFGFERRIVFKTDDEHRAFDVEKNLIQERGTHLKCVNFNGIGCNKTTGGQGASGRVVSKETCERISNSKKGKRPNKTWTAEERRATSLRMSMLHKGKTISLAHRISLKNRTDQRGEDNPTALLTSDIVELIRAEWNALKPRKWSKESGDFFRKWTDLLGVSKCTVRNVVSGASWKHLIKAQAGSEI